LAYFESAGKPPISKALSHLWHEVIAEPTFADAIVDRLVHNAYRFRLDGPSLRGSGGKHLQADTEKRQNEH
jgi:hypothetical protein